MAQIAQTYYTPEEYLAREAQTRQKHEYYQGEIYAMSGVTPSHDRITRNLIRRLDQALDTGPCEVFTADMRVFVEAAGFYTYPDASIACAATFVKVQGLESLTNPGVIVEVLSDSTADYDKTDKFELYKQLPVLHCYILVEQHRPLVQCFRRVGHLWTVETYIGPDAILPVPVQNISLVLKDIYARVEWPAPTHSHPTL